MEFDRCSTPTPSSFRTFPTSSSSTSRPFRHYRYRIPSVSIECTTQLPLIIPPHRRITIPTPITLPTPTPITPITTTLITTTHHPHHPATQSTMSSSPSRIPSAPCTSPPPTRPPTCRAWPRSAGSTTSSPRPCRRSATRGPSTPFRQGSPATRHAS